MFLCNVYVSVSSVNNPLANKSIRYLRHFDVATLDKVFQRPGFVKEMFSKFEKPTEEYLIGNITLVSVHDHEVSASYSSILKD